MSNPRNEIIIKGARVHNLKNVDLTIPRNKFIVVTGVSGSGKSSLAFETLYAEGQRRYIESLSAYARQFLQRINKPDVDYIKGIPPAIAIEQKVKAHNPRSTVGTSTEIYDYLKLLFARIGKTYSPISGIEVKRHTVSDVVDYILNQRKKTVVWIIAPLRKDNNKNWKIQLEVLLQQGFSRIINDGKVLRIRDVLKENITVNNIDLVIDRVRVADNNEDLQNRLADSVSTAFYEGNGYCLIQLENAKSKLFSNRFEEDGICFLIPTEDSFSFNNPIGACPFCEGYGKVIGIDPELVIPNKSLSIYENAIVCWRGEKMKRWNEQLIQNAHLFDFPIHKSYYRLTDSQKKLLWKGNHYFQGIDRFFKYVESKQYKIQYRIMLARYRGKTVCPSCNGSRLKKEIRYIKVNKKSIPELVEYPLHRLYVFFKNINLNCYEKKIANRILIEINSRLKFLCDIGLGYLTLNRLSSSLSGGESQRINLTTSVGSNLVGALYILDEPSIGLHPKDTQRLISVLKRLRDLGNTVLVVEHDEEIIRAADEVIDMGPFAGDRGGKVVFHGDLKSLLASDSLTAKYLNNKLNIKLPAKRGNWNNYIEIVGAKEYNLKNISIKFPLNVMTVITGVSGSGKSTLLHDIFYTAIQKHIGKGGRRRAGDFHRMKGDIDLVKDIEYVDQNPIGKSSRSNPVTYLKIYDDIRKLFAKQQAAIQLGMRPSHFSFNVVGGRCDECKGEGEIKIEMQFMADISLTCESCKGKRFKDDVLLVRYRGKNIFDILEMRISEAIDFFNNDTTSLSKNISQKLQIPANVGLDYLQLGQSSNSFSGGESQRIKLAFFLSKDKPKPTVFIFDEPTTGLHFHDIGKLLNAFTALIKKGHTLFIIEHNMDVIKCADWIIDLGVEGGEKGGEIVFAGTPESIILQKKSYTGQFLKNKLCKE